jgi:hypothetical protein
VSGQSQGPDFATFTPPGTLPVLQNIFQVSAEFLGQLRLWLSQNPPDIPISQITGFSQGVGQYSFVGTVETTTSLTYTDLATVGPQMTVTDGNYIILHGSLMQAVSGAGSVATQSVSINGSTPADADGTATNAATVLIPGTMAVLKTIRTNASNTIKVQYKGNDNTKTFQFRNRWLLAFRISN